MTVRVTFNQTCDRCERPFNQKILKAGDKVPEIKSKGYVLFATTTVDGQTDNAAKPLVEFTDLCDDCRNSVDKIIERLALNKPATAVKRKAVKPEGEAAKPAKKKRGRPSKAEIEARKAAAAEEENAQEDAPDPTMQTPEYTEPASEPTAADLKDALEKSKPEDSKKAAKDAVKAALGKAPVEEDDDLGLAGDDNAKAREAAQAEVDDDDPFPGHETFEDPETGDIMDVHTGEILAKRVDGAVQPLVDGKVSESQSGSAHPF